MADISVSGVCWIAESPSFLVPV